MLQPGRRRRTAGAGTAWRRKANSIATRSRRSPSSSDGYVAFAGQRDDGFYADIQAIFDLLKLRAPGKAYSQGGFNVHTMALKIPLNELGGDRQVVGVYATTSRRRVTILDVQHGDPNFALTDSCRSARQGNPLFNEGLVAIEDKDLYSRTSPTQRQRPVPQVRA